MKALSIVMALVAFSPCVWAAEVSVGDAAELKAAIDAAAPGDVITLAPGSYDIDANISCRVAGTAEQTITIRAETLGEVVIRFDAVEGFKVLAPHWTFENLEIRGACADDSKCEHAFHVVGEADFTTIRGNRVEGFNAHIKGNGEGDPRVYPDDVLVAYNEFYSDAPRQTSNPVTPIDVVGGRRWRIEHNHIHDFQKAQGNNVSYAAFLKGNSRDGVIAYNLVECERLHTGGVRLGLSFGGGGTGPDSICEDQTCTPEHKNGLMFNNIIANCPADVGIYVNEGQGVKIFNNTLINTTGIDIRFDASSAEVMNNLLDGAIRERDNGVATKTTNVERGALDSWFQGGAALDFALVDGSAFVDQGTTTDVVFDDFCHTARADGSNDIGALEYTGGALCDTTHPFHEPGEPPIVVDEEPSDVSEPQDTTTGTPDTEPEDAVSADTNEPDGTTAEPGEDASAPGSSEEGCGCRLRRSREEGAPLPWTLVLLMAGGVVLLRRRR